MWATFRARIGRHGMHWLRAVPWSPGRKSDVVVRSSSAAWYAAMRGLPRGRGLSISSWIHRLALTQSRHGRSMPLAKCILSQNVCRVQVGKRGFSSVRGCKARSGGRAGSRRSDRFAGRIFLKRGFHGVAWLWILYPNSQMKAANSRATATLILL